MTPERWQQIEALYHAARELPAADRSAWLATACLNDTGLQQEVERLLSQPPSHEGFLAGQARDLAAGLATHHTALANKTLGAYELQALIGVGGMGEVYRARDLKLGREVAIKVLPSGFTSDPGRLARFDREARTLAALNHPNICAIHGFERAGDIRFLVLELVAGDTLAERLQAAHARPDGPGLPDSDALHIARQIARALHFAHERGIVHRDLKPANVKVTTDGAVKVLDFGLAKATAGDAAGADLEPAPNITHNGTIEGALLGTPAYMSPEQARGKPVDKRTDIWAFGCVLYEMLTGRVAFHGDTLADTIAKVIERPPDWSALPRSTPEPIKRLLLACLAKDSRERLQNIDDVTIDGILSGSASGATRAPVVRRRNLPALLLKSAVAAALVAGIAWSVWPAPKVVQRELPLPAGQVLDGSGGAHVITISQDGSELAYVASPRLLYLWPLAGEKSEAAPVPGTERFRGVRDVELSPDGRDVAFYAFADQALMRMPVAGGGSLKISDADTPTGIHWGPDGMVLFGQGRKGIFRASVNAQGATAVTALKEGEESHGPWLLPDNDHYLFTIATGRGRDRWDDAKLFVGSLSTRKYTDLNVTGSDARYLPSLRLIVYAVSGRLWAIRFDPATLATQGNAVMVLEGVTRATGAFTGAANFSISDNGTLAYVKGLADATPQMMHIAIVEDPAGKTKPRKLKAQPDRYESLRVSPDHSTVAAGVDADKEVAVIYTIATSGTTTRQLRTPLDSDSRYPAWTRDSRRLAFQSNREGDLGIWWQAADGSGQATRLTRAVTGAEHVPESWSSDDTLLFSITIKGESSLWTTRVRNGKAEPPQRFGSQTSKDPMSATFSPDGKHVAYTRTNSGEITVCVEPYPSRFKVECMEPNLADSPKHPRWSPDGTRIYYDPRAGDFESVDVVLEPEVAFGQRRGVTYHPIRLSPPGTRTQYDVTRDGHFVGLIPAGLDEYQAKPPRSVIVIWNWFETLKQKVGWTWVDTLKSLFW